jgi:Spx/MgsR family transcriptional regulator
MTLLYGIPNCDTVKKARAWLAANGIEAGFHDYKKQGVPEAELRAWVKRLGWEALLNRKGTTWRKLDAATQAGVVDADSAIALMLAQPSVIRRPVLVRGDALRVGFDAADWVKLFG